MKVTIKIECEDEEEFLQHLSSIRLQAKRIFKKKPNVKRLSFDDNNCYGVHVVTISDRD